MGPLEEIARNCAWFDVHGEFSRLSHEQIRALPRLLAWFTEPRGDTPETEEEFWNLRKIFPKREA